MQYICPNSMNYHIRSLRSQNGYHDRFTLNLMQYAYTYISIPEITILGHSDPKMGITIEFVLKFDAIMHVHMS